MKEIAHTKKEHEMRKANGVFRLVPEREGVLWNMDHLWEERPM